MKNLILIRHAKSSWNNPSLTDFDRPLNKRGTRDAPKVGAALTRAGISFDKVLCSDARRACRTLSLVGQEVSMDDDAIVYRHSMYGASSGHLLSCIKEQPDTVATLALIGHNPGMEDLANSLAEVPVGAMSTCNAIQLEFDCDHWAELSPAKGKLMLHIKPRDLESV